VQHGLDLELDADLAADDDTAGLDREVPGGAEVVPVDLGDGREPGPLTAPRIVAPAQVLELERDRPGDAADREVTVNPVLTLAVLGDRGAPERELREPLDVEEVGAAEMGVAVGVAVSTLAASIVASTDDLIGSSAMVIAPSKPVNRPRTFDSRWRATNSTLEWEGSISHTPGAMTDWTSGWVWVWLMVPPNLM